VSKAQSFISFLEREEDRNVSKDLTAKGYKAGDTNSWGDKVDGVTSYTKTFRTEDEAREAWERFDPYLYSNKIVSSETMGPQRSHPELKWTHEVGVKNG
jgi:hypothetical protein